MDRVHIGGKSLEEKKIYIYHTNDLHSDFEYWPRIQNELLKRRAAHEANDDFVLTFDIGDAADRVHPLIEATNGQVISELFNETGYDAVTIGNNEGITYSKEVLNELYQEASFPVLLFNLKDKTTNREPDWAEAYKIIETKSGKKLGVFGLTSPFYESYEQLGWTVLDPIVATEKFMKEHQDKADFWILLSHLGIETDIELAQDFPIPLIIGAHTHHVLKNGKKVANSWLAAAGKSGAYLGEIQLGYQQNDLVVEQVHLLDSEKDLDLVPAEEKIVADYLKKGHDLLSEKLVTYAPQKYEKALFEKSPLMDLLLDAISDFAGTDVALLNAGLLMEDLKAGAVTADDLHRMLPHPIRVMKAEVKGKDLPELIEKLLRADRLIYDKKPKGNGFRGEEFGKIYSKGITIKGGKVYWLGEAIEEEKNYIFATVDYLSFYSIFDSLNTHTEQTVYFSKLLREVFGDYLSKRFTKE